MEEEEINEEWY